MKGPRLSVCPAASLSKESDLDEGQQRQFSLNSHRILLRTLPSLTLPMTHGSRQRPVLCPQGHLAMSRGFGHRNSRERRGSSWHLVGGGQGCCWTSHSAQDRPTANSDPAPDVRPCKNPIRSAGGRTASHVSFSTDFLAMHRTAQ